jgi:broad specificity phosphatase PhoE
VRGPIYLARHGETEFNRACRLQGRSDSPLTARGLDQARRVGEAVARLRAQEAGAWIVWSSPQPRALTTARIIIEAAGLDVAVRVDERLAEVGGGSFEGLTREAVLARAPGQPAHGILLLGAPDGEGYAAVGERLRAWLADVAGAGPAVHLAVSHGGTGRILRGLALGLERAALEALPTPQDALFRLEGGRETRIDCP